MGSPSRVGERFPRGLGYAFSFDVFNTLSFSIVQGLPIQLFCKTLDAPAVLVAFAPAILSLMMVLQLPAARHAERSGYKPFLVRGWSLRNLLVAAIAVCAFAAPWLGPGLALLACSLLLALYAALRGWFGCAWLPWFSQLVPLEMRGRYLARQMLCIQLASIVSLAASTLLLRRTEAPWAFGVLFLGSFAAGAVSILFIRRIPEVPVDASGEGSGGVPWRSLLGHRPFARLLAFSLLVNLLAAGAQAFWVPMLRDLFAAGSDLFTALLMLSTGVNACVQLGLGRVLDRAGSRPVLTVGMGILVVHYAIWTGVAIGALPPSLPVLVAAQVSAGLGWSMVFVASTRLLMLVVPGQGRSHFFALHTVTTGLALGLLPLAWGGGLDLLHGWRPTLGPWSGNGFALVTLLLCLLAASGTLVVRILPEPQAMGTAAFLHDLVLRTPARALLRLAERTGVI